MAKFTTFRSVKYVFGAKKISCDKHLIRRSGFLKHWYDNIGQNPSSSIFMKIPIYLSSFYFRALLIFARIIFAPLVFAHPKKIFSRTINFRAANNFQIFLPNKMTFSGQTTIPHKNIETNNKFYRKVAFLMYTEMVNFRPQS